MSPTFCKEFVDNFKGSDNNNRFAECPDGGNIAWANNLTKVTMGDAHGGDTTKLVLTVLLVQLGVVNVCMLGGHVADVADERVSRRSRR